MRGCITEVTVVFECAFEAVPIAVVAVRWSGAVLVISCIRDCCHGSGFMYYYVGVYCWHSVDDAV